MLNFVKEELQKLNKESEETTWHIIAENGDVEIIRKKYFDLDEREINLKNEEDLTPLAIAVKNDNVEIFKELINCGARYFESDKLSFLKASIENKNAKIYMFLASTTDVNFVENSLHKACIYNSLEDVQQSIKDGVDLQDTFFYKRRDDFYFEKATALHVAVVNNNKPIVEELIKEGIDSNAGSKIYNGKEFLEAGKEYTALDASEQNSEIYNIILDKTRKPSGDVSSGRQALSAKRIKIDSFQGKLSKEESGARS